MFTQNPPLKIVQLIDVLVSTSFFKNDLYKKQRAQCSVILLISVGMVLWRALFMKITGPMIFIRFLSAMYGTVSSIQMPCLNSLMESEKGA